MLGSGLLDISKDGDSTVSRQLMPVLSHPRCEKVFPDVRMESPMFQFVLIASDPVTGHHISFKNWDI